MSSVISDLAGALHNPSWPVTQGRISHDPVWLARDSQDARWHGWAALATRGDSQVALPFYVMKRPGFASTLWREHVALGPSWIREDHLVFVGGMGDVYAGLVTSQSGGTDARAAATSACLSLFKDWHETHYGDRAAVACNLERTTADSFLSAMGGTVWQHGDEFFLGTDEVSSEQQRLKTVREVRRRDERAFREASLRTRVSVGECLESIHAPLIALTQSRHGIQEPERLIEMRLQWLADRFASRLVQIFVSRERSVHASAIGVLTASSLELMAVGVRDERPNGVHPYLAALVYGPLRCAQDLGLDGIWLGYDAARTKTLRGAHPIHRFGYARRALGC